MPHCDSADYMFGHKTHKNPTTKQNDKTGASMPLLVNIFLYTLHFSITAKDLYHTGAKPTTFPVSMIKKLRALNS